MEHEKCMQEIKEIAEAATTDSTPSAVDWLRAQMAQAAKRPQEVGARPSVEEQERLRKEQERQEAILELKKQQETISRQLAELQGTNPSGGHNEEDTLGLLKQSLAQGGDSRATQDMLMQQLKATLTGKKEEDPNKALIKAFLTAQNKVPSEGGTNTLKSTLMQNLLAGEGNAMADWLANLNKQEEGESHLSRAFLSELEGLGRQGKAKSGILDKATTNIQQKQVWPQQNLGEDWADEEVEFKQMKFEHLVAGETRTIETSTDPAQILGRLRLLRQVAYLKLRGYEWHLIRKMYAAILTSIETKEYSWESNFDYFETILYRKTVCDHRNHHPEQRHGDREQGGRKRFCRDYNKAEGCPKNSPHAVWLGNGPSAVKKMVYHYCAVCLIRDRQQREHPEGHPDCPHKD